MTPIPVPGRSFAALPMAGPPLERRDAAANRARILGAARQILTEQGAAGLSMNSVAVAAGVGKGTIFRRFGDRNGLLRALLDEHAIELQNAWLTGPPPLGPGAAPGRRLEAFITALLDFQHRNLELLLAAEQHSDRSTPPATGTFLLHLTKLVHEIEPALNAPVVARLLLNSVAPPAIDRCGRDIGARPEEINTAALALLHGLTGAPSPRPAPP
jgi:AcrR family transcriptional regulator